MDIASTTNPVSWPDPTAQNFEASVQTSCNPVSGTTFAVGQSTTVTCSAADGAGNADVCTFNVVVGKCGVFLKS